LHKDAEKRTLLFKGKRQYEAEGKGHRAWDKQLAVRSKNSRLKGESLGHLLPNRPKKSSRLRPA
jgi:hypothetical protein